MVDVGEAARRAVLDHLLALSVWSEGGERLVLRGSMPLAGWYLRYARPPGDLDWLVLAGAEPTWAPSLYGSLRDLARDLPDARLEPPLDHISYGTPAVGSEHLSPAGLRAEHRRRWEHGTQRDSPLWTTVDWTEPPDPVPAPHEALLDLVRVCPVVPGPTGDITLQPDRATTTGLWEYADPGLRLTIPWHAPGLPAATTGCDFAPLRPDGPEPAPRPVLTAIPRGDGGWPTTVPTVDRGLALAWKLQWLHTDNHPEDKPWYYDEDEDEDEDDEETEHVAKGKDLYDAVLLAEDPATDLDLPRLREIFEPAWHHTTGGPAAVADWITSWHIDWSRPGTAADWQTRLATALSRRWWPGRARSARQ